MNRGKVILGTFAGVAAGAIAGILFAPKKGSDTRQQIVEKKEVYKNGLQAKLNDLQSTFSEKLRRNKKKAEKISDRKKAKVEKAQNETVNAKESLKKDIEAEMRQS
jgi:gas vesicle protein